jgi:hypothetical protein
MLAGGQGKYCVSVIHRMRRPNGASETIVTYCCKFGGFCHREVGGGGNDADNRI